MSEVSATAREQARRGRLQQLETLAKFEEGEAVVFKVHNDKKGFKLAKAQIKDKGHNGQKIRFPNEVLLMEATVNGDLDTVNRLLDAGVDPNAVDADGLTPLHRACVENHLPIVSTLLARGANVNARDHDWWTPLHASCASGNWRVASSLINNGADVQSVNSEGDLPIDLVCDSKVEGVIQREMQRLELSEDKVEALRGADAAAMLRDVKQMAVEKKDLNKPDENGATLLHIAACNGYSEVVAFLVRQPGVQVNARDPEGNTPLHLACFWQQYDAVMHLASNGADFSAKNRHDTKPIIMTEDATMIRLVQALEKKVQQDKGPADKLAAATDKLSLDTPKIKAGGSIRHTNRAKVRAELHKDLLAEGTNLSSSRPDEPDE